MNFTMEEMRRAHPGMSDEWLSVWLRRIVHYSQNGGDMTDAPSFPPEVDNRNVNQ